MITTEHSKRNSWTTDRNVVHEFAEAPRTTEIPVPPYDRELPRGYWEGLQKPAVQKAPNRLTRTVLGWCLLGVPLFLYTSAWVTQKCLDLNQTGFKMESMGAPNPEPQSAVSRSEESFSSRTSTPAPKAIGTGRYWVTLPQPDGRRILVNYKGTIDSSKGDLLPVQPPGGADNAMYLDLGTGYSWIWTVPAGASNIAQWIDP